MLQTLISANECINGGNVRVLPTNSRFNSQLLSPNIANAEERFLLPLLCRPFLNALIAAKTSDRSQYNDKIEGGIVEKFGNDADFEFLWRNYLMEVTARGVYVVSLPQIGIQTGSNGLYLNNSNFSENAGIKGLQFLIDDALQGLRMAENRMKAYMCVNFAKFTLWPKDKFCKENCGCSNNDECDCEVLTPKDKNTIKGGWIFY